MIYRRSVTLLMLIAFSLVGCTKEVTRYHTKITYEEKEVTVPVTHKEQIPEYADIPPLFPVRSGKPISLAVLPFTSSLETGIGTEVAEELSYRMVTHPRTDRSYRIVDRTQLRSILTEKEMETMGKTEIKKAGKLLNIDGIVTGHVREGSGHNLSYILKAISAKDASIMFTHRFEGGYDQALDAAVDAFFEHRVVTGYRTVETTEYKTETRKEPVEENVPYTEEEIALGRTIALVSVSGLALIGVIVFVTR